MLLLYGPFFTNDCSTSGHTTTQLLQTSLEKLYWCIKLLKGCCRKYFWVTNFIAMKRILKLRLLFLLLCIGHLPTYSQTNVETLYGKVTDSLSKQALPLATIQLQGITDTAFRQRTLTDTAGNFVFTAVPQGVYALEVQYIGYKTYVHDSLQIVPGEVRPPLQIVLPLAGKSLGSVTVTGAKPYIELDADKLVLNIASRPVAAGSNGYDVLAAAPGVTEENDALQFRGKPVTVLINGRPSNLSGEALKQMLSGMPANSIEKIELISNPSARYDAQGGAVVNIRLAKNKNYGTNGTLTAGAGAGRNGRYNGGISLNNRYKNRNLYGSYNYQHSTIYQENRSNRLLPLATIGEDEYGLRYHSHTQPQWFRRCVWFAPAQRQQRYSLQSFPLLYQQRRRSPGSICARKLFADPLRRHLRRKYRRHRRTEHRCD